MTTPPALSAGSSYDETPYPSSSFSQSHPHKLAALGRLFGLATPDPAQARVLELGCADGANLLPMAQDTPGGRFLGIDASARQIAQGQAAIAATGLTNIELRCQDILEFAAAEGRFDYIIVHGIFSWVPEEVREKILAICRDHLTENGVAYVSYNAFPGWSMRTGLRDMMLFHTANQADPKAKVQQARALTAFLSEAVPTENNPYGLLLKRELEAMKKHDDNYLRHDILEETNQPFYFHQFMQRATRMDLQYLGESALHLMLASEFPENVRKTLDGLGLNLVAKEQYMDFVRNRNFRETLLCRAGARLKRALVSDSIRPFYYSSVVAKPDPGTLNLAPGVRHDFKSTASPGATISSDRPLAKAAFDTLADYRVDRISFGELLEKVRAQIAPWRQGDAEQADRSEDATLADALLQAYASGFIDIFAARIPLHRAPPPRPRATPLARHQVAQSLRATNHAHGAITFGILGAHVLKACDGENDVEAILEVLVKAAREGTLTVREGEATVADEGRLRLLLQPRLHAVLQQAAAGGFFAA